MSRFSFAPMQDRGPASSVAASSATGTAFAGWHPEAGTLMTLAVVEAILLVGLRRYFRHSHGG
jgi:hypothetical protein